MSEYLFFTSEKDNYRPFSDTRLNINDINNHYDNLLFNPQNGLGDIYWIDANVIDEFKIKN